MAQKYSNFRSQTAITERQEENRKARQIVVEQAKKKYEKEEARKEKARKQGEGTWMLNSVSERIDNEEKALKKAKKKKAKKSKKKKKKSRHASSSSSDDSENENAQWVEAKTASENDRGSSSVKGPKLQRESWMEASLDLIPTITRETIREAADREKAEAKREAEKTQQPGQHARELNPYWKDGGTGLPEEKPETQKKSALPFVTANSGDGGLSWLRQAYRRCQQQAKDEGRSLEDVAAERWGSLKSLEKQLHEAERKNRGEGKYKDFTNRSRRRNEESSLDEKKRVEEYCRRDRDRERRRDTSMDRERNKGSRDNERIRGMDRRGGRRRSHDRSDDDVEDSRHRVKDRPNGRLAFHRPHSDSDDDERRPNSHTSPQSHGENSLTRKRSFMKPTDSRKDLDSPTERSSSRGFMKPVDVEYEEDKSDSRNSNSRHTQRSDDSRYRDSQKSQSSVNARDIPRWKKKQFEAETGKEKTKEDMRRRKRRDKRSRSSSSDTSSSSSDSSDEADSDLKGEVTEDQPPPPAPTILSEEELNALAAKILRAEIMGDDSMAEDLKSQLEAARKHREMAATAGGASAPNFCHVRRGEMGKRDAQGRRGEEREDDNVVVLSRSSKGGLVRPVLGSSDDVGGAGGKKRRMKNVSTHDKEGGRTMYFDDDDKFDLKTLVEQEKAGTAEDQNSMFARLAARSGDRDLDVDDMFVSKAAKQQKEDNVFTKDRAAAIFEHRKINSAMEKCHRCFDKVPKHLIIAIGSKSYLCVPHHRSLTEGHCLIVPISHTAAATTMDEDVWQEMQLFRKCLVQMFAAQDLDVVVMETVMHLKHFPHTVIECIPLDREIGDLSPIYFKKAIQEVGPEWSDNKKLHDLRGKDVRHVIPKGFPYFAVDFGLQSGFATVIEDEASFPAYFGREIVGGMIDAEPALWRKPHKQSFEDQRKKVLAFEQWWKPFDWTRNLNAGD